MDMREIKNEIKREIKTELELYQEKVDHNTKELELLKQISTDNLMACLELRKSQEALGQNIQKLEKDQETLTQNVQNLTQSVQKLEKDQETLTQNFHRFQDEMKEFKNEMKEFKDEMKQFKTEINKKWGELANRLGTLAEDIFGPGIPYLLKNLGFETKGYFFDFKVGPEGRRRQYDVLIFAEAKDGKEKVFMVEVKNQGRSENFDQIKSLLEALPVLYPAVKGRDIIPVLAAFRFGDGVKTYASKRGVLLVRMGGEYLEPLNREVLDQ